MNEIKIRTNNSAEGIKKIEKLWQDIMGGNTSLVLDKNTILISKYSNYASDENGDYDLSILSVDSEFLQKLETDEKFKKYDFCSGSEDVAENIKAAWQQVWRDQQQGRINRSYAEDYECTIPVRCSEDHKLHCLLYISIAKNS